MGKSISLEILLQSENICVCDILKAFIDVGWMTMCEEGYTTYLQLEDKDMFDWVTEKKSISSLMEICLKKELSGEIVGVMLHLQNTNTGMTFLLHEPCKISLVPEKNQIYLGDDNLHLDYNWYIENVMRKIWSRFPILMYRFSWVW